MGVEPINEYLLFDLQSAIDGLTIINGYGPSETTICSTLYLVGNSVVDNKQTLTADRVTPIGLPVQNNSHYVLSKGHKLQPQGCVGELYIGGAGLARGYLNQPALTDQRFIANPFNQGKLYKTGDLVKHLPDGNLVFVGRGDDQVKVHGYRIELGEIEHQLAQFAQVNSAVVLVRDEQLVAYVVMNNDDSFEVLKASLQQTLPGHMVPAIFVALDEMPLTPSGKINKKALPDPEASQTLSIYAPPVSDTEITLVAICAELLKIEKDTLSINANFFASGGHSLLSVRLVGEVRTQLDVELAIRDVFNYPQLSALADFIDKNTHKATRPPVVAIERNSELLPSSFAQQRLWFIDQMEGASAQYNMPGAFRFNGAFEAAIVEQAFSRIISRHEPLRTVFVNSETGVLQHIKSEFNFKLSIVDLTFLSNKELDEKAQQAAVLQAAQLDAEKTFDLAQDLMLRSSFIRLSNTQGVLLFNLHHIASDGWSMGLLVSEFWSEYQAILNGLPSEFAPLAIQYADYAQWQRAFVEQQMLASQLLYWDEKLADLPQMHSLPLDKPRPKEQGFNGGIALFDADKQTLDGLKHLALSHNATLFMVLQGAFALLLSRHSNTHDIVMGVPMANRLQKELEGLIGFFINTQVLRTDCSGNPTFADFLNKVKTTNLDAQANQDVPFEHLVERLQPQRSTEHSPLFQIMFSMNTNDSLSQGKAFELPGLSLSQLVQDDAPLVAKFELTLNVTETTNGLEFGFEYNTDLFEPATIERLGAHLLRLLGGIVANPQCVIGQLPMLSDAEQQYLVHTLNAATSKVRQQSSIHELFEAQVKATPDNIAITEDEQTLTYKTLNQKANQLAHYLRSQGVKPDTLVGICTGRSLDMMVGLLAIVKAGGAYVPLDPNYPQNRLDYMVKDSSIKLLLSQTSIAASFDCDDLTTLMLDDESVQMLLRDESNLNLDIVFQQQPAYMIYTSGSTGQPKGVLNEHAALVNLCDWHINQYGCDGNSRATHLASIGFDAAVWEVWPYLLCGAQVTMVPDEVRQSPADLLGLFAKNHISHCFMPTALLEMMATTLLADANLSLQYVLTGGQKLGALALNTASDVKIINHYGPTEAAVVSTACVLSLNDNTVPPIGKPISNVWAYVLSPEGALVPKGSVGELYIGGASVARGYFNRPELTALSFLDNPFSDGRLYKTGDLVRYLADDNLAFVDRIDDQVKIRGFRIELGEIEHQLSQLSQVKTVVVQAREDEPGVKYLVAYIVLTEKADEQTLTARWRKDLLQTLPEYMVPAHFVVLDALPLTSNGKVDKKALPKPDGGSMMGEYIGPAT
ncbi:MAG: amino acid adenylation domain-containing protein, partial [Algicola sp.]|nr:amino acid adenylation domain-containing protein [Algicola sp.]